MNEFIPYNEALALKKLGFNTPTRDFYRITGSGPFAYVDYVDWNNDKEQKTAGDMTYVSAPLYQQAFRWFREKYKIEGEVHCIRFDSPKLRGYQYVTIKDNYTT